MWGAFGAIGPSLVGLWIGFRSRRLVAAQEKRDSDKIEFDADARERAQLSTDQQALVKDLREEIKDLRTAKRAIELDREDGWDRARGWNEAAHINWHAWANTCQALAGRLDIAKIPYDDVTFPGHLPAFDDVKRKHAP
jgi:hypothetical protein